MRRREFIALLGGATAAWPLTVRAQRPESVRRIGALIPGDASGAATRAQAFREGLATLGWTDGDNIQIEYVWATGDVDRLRSDVAKLRALAPEVIVTGGTEVTTAVREVLGSVPIVFVHVLDPVSAGFVESLARPGGAATGFTSYEASIGGKWLELLKELAPRIDHVLVLVGHNPTWRLHVPTIERAAAVLNVHLTITPVDNPKSIEPSIVAFAGKPNSGMIALPDNILDSQREIVAALAAKHRIAAVYGNWTMGGERRVVTLQL